MLAKWILRASNDEKQEAKSTVIKYLKNYLFQILSVLPYAANRLMQTLSHSQRTSLALQGPQVILKL